MSAVEIEPARPAPDPQEIERAARELTGKPPERVLAWAANRFAPRIALSTAFGAEGCVLVDVIARHHLPIDVFTIDTGLLFAETYALWRGLERRYGIRIHGVKPELDVAAQARVYGDRLWESDPDRCCALRKVAPLGRALRGLDAWITSIRSEETRDRAAARTVEIDDRFGLVKVNPLLGWTSHQVRAHLRDYAVPYNPLHDQGYPSIGCVPCTSPVSAGEDPRAGRWRGRAKTECGLHNRPRARTLTLTSTIDKGV